MYRLDDKSAAIKNIQRYLKKVLDNNEMQVTGIFDKATLNLLNEYQRRYGLSITNYVGYEALSLLYDSFLKKSAEYQINNLNFPIQKGQASDNIYSINKMISEVLIHYGNFHPYKITRYYSKQTEDDVKRLKIIFGMQDTPSIDIDFYLRLVSEWNSINKFCD